MRLTLATIILSAGLLSSAAYAAVSVQVGQCSEYEKAGSESFSIGDFASAETKFRSALDLMSSDSTMKSKIPALEVKYTNALMSQGKFKESAKELKKTLSLTKSISGTNSIDYGLALDLQSWLYQANGKMDNSIASLKDSISILESKDAGSSDLADAYEHMGLLQDTVGLFDPAQNYYTKALDIRSKLCGSNSVEVADLDEDLAHLAQKRGQGGNAPQFYLNALRIKESRGEPWKHYAPEPTERVVVFHYLQGAPNCQQGSSDGTDIERITANGITVEAGLSQKPSNFAKTTRALVRIHNDSQYDVDVLSQPPTFIQITPNVEILKPLNPAELAARIEKKGESKAKWIKFWGADAMTQVQSTAYTNGNMPVYGYVPNAFGWSTNNNNNWNNRNRNNNWQSTTVTSMVPDYQAREEAYRKAQAATEKSKSDALAIRDASLGADTLSSGGSMQGALDFEFSKYESAILRIPIGNAIYEFRFE